jgi:hypothetical protein
MSIEQSVNTAKETANPRDERRVLKLLNLLLLIFTVYTLEVGINST